MKSYCTSATALALILGGWAVTTPKAQAMSGPAAIAIDGGPLGSLSLSGGADGYGYYVSNPYGGSKDHGIEVSNALIELQKSSGVLQFTIEVGSSSALTLGTNTPPHTSITTYTTGPLYEGYITIAPPNAPVTFSAGQLGSLEGYEAGLDWYNAVQLTTSLFYVQNANSRGVMASYTHGPLTALVQFGDGYDTGVFNFLQGLASYSINSSNSVSLYYAGNLGTTGLNAYGYGGTTVGTYGANFVNSQMLGGYYSYTQSNLNLVPEVQYVYAKANQKLGLTKESANFGAALFGDYSFANTPYSLGGWVEYEDSTGPDFWFSGPKSKAFGAALAPSWQYKELFARANVGAIYLLNNKSFSTASYGADGTDKFQLLGTLEAGLLF